MGVTPGHNRKGEPPAQPAALVWVAWSTYRSWRTWQISAPARAVWSKRGSPLPHRWSLPRSGGARALGGVALWKAAASWSSAVVRNSLSWPRRRSQACDAASS